VQLEQPFTAQELRLHLASLEDGQRNPAHPCSVLGSLREKGLIRQINDEEGIEGCNLFRVTDLGLEWVRRYQEAEAQQQHQLPE
jgi:hypothetical protein